MTVMIPIHETVQPSPRGTGMKALTWAGVVIALAWTSCCWAQPAGAPTPQASSNHVAIIVNPDWLKKPSIDDMLAVYPAAANGMSGKATIHCWVQTSGLLRSCDVRQESPKEKGFGGAALALSKFFLMKPKTIDGQPVESEVTIPIAFGGGVGGGGPTTGTRIGNNDSRSDRDSGRGSGSGSGNITVFSEPIWDKTPTIPEIQAEIDQKVGDKFADGKVAFQCAVAKRTGLLSDCTIVNSSPGMDQFKGVARTLTSKFQANPQALADAKTEEIKVNLVFSFPDMASDVWGKRYLTRPQWIRTPSIEPGQKTFPDEAAKAGLKTGSATVDCVIGPDGGLTQCAVVSESTPGVGFGVMAVKLAQGFATNPWTDDGVPAGGAHVRLPIQLVDPGPDKPASAPTPATKP